MNRNNADRIAADERLRKYYRLWAREWLRTHDDAPGKDVFDEWVERAKRLQQEESNR